MTTLNSLHRRHLLPAHRPRSNSYADAGIDPAFDADMEELERQFAELRLTFNHN